MPSTTTETASAAGIIALPSLPAEENPSGVGFVNLGGFPAYEAHWIRDHA
ncbi:hypothetical protein [Streptomyces goshikiensis]